MTIRKALLAVILLMLAVLTIYALLRATSTNQGVTPGNPPKAKCSDNAFYNGVFCDKRGFCCSNSITTHVSIEDGMDDYANKSLVISTSGIMFHYIELDKVRLEEYSLKRSAVTNPILRSTDIQCGKNYTVSLLSGGFADWTSDTIANLTLASTSFFADGRLMRITLSDNNTITIMQVDQSCDFCREELSKCDDGPKLECPEYHVWNHYYEIPGNRTHVLFNGEIVSRDLLSKCFNVSDIRRWDWVHRAEEANCPYLNYNCYGNNWTNCTCEPYIYPEDRKPKEQKPSYVHVEDIRLNFSDQNMTCLSSFFLLVKPEDNSKWHNISWDGSTLQLDNINIISIRPKGYTPNNLSIRGDLWVTRPVDTPFCVTESKMFGDRLCYRCKDQNSSISPGISPADWMCPV